MRSDETRRTNDRIVESQLGKTGQSESQDSGSKRWIEKVRQNIGPAFAAFTMGLAVQGSLGIGGVEGSTPEASGTALALRGSDNAMRPPAFPEQRTEIIGKSPTEPYVPAPRPEWLSPHQSPTTQQLWPDLYDQMVKASEEEGQASKTSLQGETQETHDEGTASGQEEQNKNKVRKLLSSREEKIATVRALIDKLEENPEALQIFKKRLNGKKERERSLLESNPEIARRRLDIPINPDYNYTQLTPTEAQAQLQYSQAFQDATQYLGKQPDWNNTYAYNVSGKDIISLGKGIVAIYTSEGYSTTFLVVDNPSAGNDTLGLLGQLVVQSNETAWVAWSTPQGKPFVAQLMWPDGGNEPAEVLVSGDINWGNFRFSPAYFASASGPDGLRDQDCFNCEASLFKDQSSCSSCVLDAGPFGIYNAKQGYSIDQYTCLNVSLSGVDPAVQLWPYMIKISGELYIQNNCPWELNGADVYVGFNYVCPPRTCPPGRAYYALDNDAVSFVLNPGERKLFSNFGAWVYCSTFNEMEKVNYISLPTTIDMNIIATGDVVNGSGYWNYAYSPNMNFHVYDASMYPDLRPYPAIPSACGENDPNCTQLCARHPEVNIPSGTMPTQFSEAPAPSPEAPAPRPKAHARASTLVWGLAGGIGGGSLALMATAAWYCSDSRRRENCIRFMRSIWHKQGEVSSPKATDRPPEQNPSPGDRLLERLGNYQIERLLGKGAFSAVYLGKDLHLEVDVVIKVLHKADERSSQAFIEEARMIAQLDDSHIVRARCLEEENGIHYLVMDYPRHRTLKAAHPLKTRVPLEDVVAYVNQIARTLDYAHRENVIHRDIRPENLFLAENMNGEKNILIGNFGFSQDIKDINSKITCDGEDGNFAYMAPEQMQGMPCKESDQYALGVVVYQWLSGHLPFQGTTDEIRAQKWRLLLIGFLASGRKCKAWYSWLWKKILINALRV